MTEQPQRLSLSSSAVTEAIQKLRRAHAPDLQAIGTYLSIAEQTSGSVDRIDLERLLDTFDAEPSKAVHKNALQEIRQLLNPEE